MNLEKIIKKSKKALIGTLIAAQAMSINSCSNPVSENNNNDNYIEYQEEQTNSEGEVIFENGETINIIDSETSEPIKNTNVKYYHDESEDYKVITVQNENYLPAIRYFENFSEETIGLQNSENQDYTFREINQEEGEPLMKFLKESIENNESIRNTNCSDYKGTATGERILHDQEIFDTLVSYIVPKGGLIIEVLHLFQNLDAILNGYPNFEEMTLANNWDIYSVDDPNYNLDIETFIESNQPNITIDNIDTFPGTLNFTFSATDDTEYSNQSNETIEDQTIPCRGPTNLNDLVCDYTIEGQNGQETAGQITGTIDELISKNITINNLPTGNYSLNLTIHDDTTYEDETPYNGINEGTNGVNFTIDEDQGIGEINIIQTHDYPNMYGANDLTWFNGNLWSTSAELDQTCMGRIFKHNSDMNIIATYDWPNQEMVSYIGGITNKGNNFLISDVWTDKLYEMSYPPTQTTNETNFPQPFSYIGDLTTDGNHIYGIDMWQEKLVKMDNNLNLIEQYSIENSFNGFTGTLVCANNSLWGIGPENKLQQWNIINSELNLLNEYTMPESISGIDGLAYDGNNFYASHTSSGGENKVTKFRIE